MANLAFKSGSRVLDDRFGFGTVELDKGATVIARFEHVRLFVSGGRIPGITDNPLLKRLT